MVGASPAGASYAFLAPLEQPIRRRRLSPAYLCCLALVACAMLLLPLIYLAFVAGLGWAVYYHAFHNFSAIMSWGGFSGGGKLVLLKFLFYVAPLIAGLVVLFFLFKPLLARPPKQPQPLALNPADNPLLYAFISKICDAVGAPAPRRIDLNCQLNAAAGFRRGFWSLFSNDLVLVIGLPLAGNLTARELAGVIAHEFGHFTQGAGMRLSYVILAINDWFARVAYERDEWDVALEQWAQETDDGRAALLVWTVQLSVWLSRLVLKTLLYTGHIIGGFMLRQMEYDADACQIQLVGSATMEATHRKIATLAVAEAVARKQILALWKERGQLPDNLCEVLRQAHEQLPAEARQRIEDTLGLHRATLFSSHPSPGDRIRRARQAAAPGIFHDDRPASTLFASFHHPARFVTLLYYTDDLGIPITADMVLHVETGETQADLDSLKAQLEQYFLGVLPLLAPLCLTPPAPAADLAATDRELNDLFSSLQQVSEQLGPIAQQFREMGQQLVSARTARCLLNAGVPIQSSAFNLSEPTMAAAVGAETEARQTRDDLRNSLHEVAAALTRRLQLGLSLRLTQPADEDVEPFDRERLQELVKLVNEDAEREKERSTILEALAVLDRIAGVAGASGETPALSQALDAQRAELSALLAKSVSRSTPMPTQAALVTPSGPGLHLAQQAAYLGPADLEQLRSETIAGSLAYRKRLGELVQIARAAEQLPA